MFRPGEIWTDTAGVPINAHGGGVLLHEGIYYWFGEHKIAFVRCQQNGRAAVGRHPRLTTNEEKSGDGKGRQPKADGRDRQHACFHRNTLRDRHRPWQELPPAFALEQPTAMAAE